MTFHKIAKIREKNLYGTLFFQLSFLINHLTILSLDGPDLYIDCRLK